MTQSSHVSSSLLWLCFSTPGPGPLNSVNTTPPKLTTRLAVDSLTLDSSFSFAARQRSAKHRLCLQEQIHLTKTLAEPLSQLQQAARHIAETSQECKLDLEPEEYVESFKPFSMDITYHWSKVPHVNVLVSCLSCYMLMSCVYTVSDSCYMSCVHVESEVWSQVHAGSHVLGA